MQRENGLPSARRTCDARGPVEIALDQFSLRRMKKEYVPPTEADIAGAPALVIVPSAGMTPASDAWRPFLALLEPLVSTGTLAGKVAAVIDAGDSQTVASFSAALAARGFALIAGDDRDARAHGRAVGTAIISAASPSAH